MYVDELVRSWVHAPGLYDLVGDLSLSLVIVIVLLQVLSLRAWRAALTL